MLRFALIKRRDICDVQSLHRKYPVCVLPYVTSPMLRENFPVQWWAMKLSTEAVATILRVDQIIMAKQAGGPKPRQGPADEED